MTEAVWLASDDPVAMLRLITENPDHANIDCIRSDRKLRLFACACFRRFGPADVHARVLLPGVEALADAGAVKAQYLALDPLLLSDGTHWAQHWAHKPGVDRAAQAALLRCLFGNPFRPVGLPCHCFCGPRKQWPVTGECPDCASEGWCPWLTPAVTALARHAYDGRDFAALPVLADALEEAGCPATITDYQPPPDLHPGEEWYSPRSIPNPLLSHLRETERPCPRNYGEGLKVGPGWTPPPWFVRERHFGCEVCGGTGRLPSPHARGCWALDLLLGKE